MSHNYYQTTIFAKEHIEQLRRETQHFEQVKEAQKAKAAQKQAQKLAYLSARGWAANANR